MKRILLVTERCKTHSLPMVLAHAGYEVVEPRVPSEATKVMHSEHIDLVVLGHCLPAKRRETLVALIHRQWPEVPIVCVAEDPLKEAPTGDANIVASCRTMLWAIEHAAK